MSDQYVPKDSPGYAGYRSGTEPRFPEAQPAASPVDATRSGGSGLGTALMVCGVFVVIAIFAATFYSPSDISYQDINQPAERVIESDGLTVPVPAESIPGIVPEVAPSAADPGTATVPGAAPAAPAQP